MTKNVKMTEDMDNIITTVGSDMVAWWKDAGGPDYPMYTIEEVRSDIEATAKERGLTFSKTQIRRMLDTLRPAGGYLDHHISQADADRIIKEVKADMKHDKCVYDKNDLHFDVTYIANEHKIDISQIDTDRIVDHILDHVK